VLRIFCCGSVTEGCFDAAGFSEDLVARSLAREYGLKTTILQSEGKT
jgi:hypothetical protein